MKTTFLTILFFQLFIVKALYSQQNVVADSSTVLFIKPYDKEIHAGIKKVAFYGITLENGETVMYKVISKIITGDEKIIDSVRHYVSNTGKIVQGDKYILDMTNATYVLPEPKSELVIESLAVMLNYQTSRAENFELAINFAPKFLKQLYLQLSTTYGSYYNDIHYNLLAVSAGIGGIYKSNYGEVLFGINHGRKTLTYDRQIGRSQTDQLPSKAVTYFEVVYRNNFFNNWLIVSGGSKYYFNNITVDNLNTSWGLSLGLGIKFFKQ